jgi:predicted lysophospholipase L1 biosynthesis ABC-type transport system permease subunit
LDNRRGNDRHLDAENQSKEDEMETGTQNEKEQKLETKKTGLQKFLSGFMKFLMMGGFIVILMAIAGIAILISYLTK